MVDFAASHYNMRCSNMHRMHAVETWKNYKGRFLGVSFGSQGGSALAAREIKPYVKAGAQLAEQITDGAPAGVQSVVRGLKLQRLKCWQWIIAEPLQRRNVSTAPRPARVRDSRLQF